MLVSLALALTLNRSEGKKERNGVKIGILRAVTISRKFTERTALNHSAAILYFLLYSLL
jgi:hypothetical protein